MNNIESNNKIKVYWDDLPENYSKELKNRVTTYFSNKYNVAKNNVNVVFRPIKKDSEGNIIEITDSGVDNIMDINYQRELMGQWLEINQKKVDLKRLYALDDKINADVNFNPSETRHRRWGIKWLEINNFLCFGQNNKVNFKRYKGLNLVNSEPANQGGKTTFNIDTIKFLLFGKTTKTEKNEEIFNDYTDEDEVTVKGEIEINPHNIVIERKMTRKAKRDGGWSVSNKVKYYQVMPDGSHEELNDEDATSTTKLITNAVGKEEDFDITTLATANNLESLIEMKPAMNGKLLNRFIGLEIIDDKLAACRKRYNEFNSKKLGNVYNVITLRDEIEDLETKDESLKSLLETHTETLSGIQGNLDELVEKKEELLSNKVRVDDELFNVNTEKLQTKLDKIVVDGKAEKAKSAELAEEIKELGAISFDEDLHHELTKEKNVKEVSIRNKNSDISQLESAIKSLENDEICDRCNRPLDDVDNSGKIVENKDKIKVLKGEIEELTSDLVKIDASLVDLNTVKVNIDKKDRLEVTKDKVDVQISSLKQEYREITALLKKYQENKDAIDKNKSLDNEINQVKTKIIATEKSKTDTTTKINNINIELATIDKDIKTKKVQIEKILKEEEVERIFKLYIEMYGKKGIGKMVLRSVLPIINSELVRLMEDVCDFTIELDINHKNDVEYMINRGGVTKQLKSGSGLEKTIASLALRTVLGKMAYLPMPNFISFDEVLGKVAPENLIKLEDIFNKIKELYDMVFLITHNDIVKDWADSIITIKKVNRVSSISLT